MLKLLWVGGQDSISKVREGDHLECISVYDSRLPGPPAMQKHFFAQRFSACGYPHAVAQQDGRMGVDMLAQQWELRSTKGISWQLHRNQVRGEAVHCPSCLCWGSDGHPVAPSPQSSNACQGYGTDVG